MGSSTGGGGSTVGAGFDNILDWSSEARRMVVLVAGMGCMCVGESVAEDLDRVGEHTSACASVT